MNLKSRIYEWFYSFRQARYEKIINRFKNKKKIKVVFLNCEASKWAYQSIYEYFAQDDRFEVQVLVSVYEMLIGKKYNFLHIRERLKENFNFFKNLGMNVEYAFDYEKNRPLDLKKFSPDIIFYDEPRSVAKVQSVNITSKYALPMHCTYGSCISNANCELGNAYRKLFAFFADNPYIVKLLLDNGFSKGQVYLAGQPKIDAYLKPVCNENVVWKTDKKHIIYAPHFSFDNNTEMRFGTFDWNYKFFYDYAKNHPEFEFILKPHPSLKREIVKRRLMSVAEMEQYFREWADLPNAQVSEEGNYIDMFRTSDLLITDCNSFLYEYLLTEKPVIHLINRKSVGFNEFGERIIEGYYNAYTVDDVVKYLNSILVLNEDSLAQKRKDIIKNCLNFSEGGAAKKVFDYVCKECRVLKEPSYVRKK